MREWLIKKLGGYTEQEWIARKPVIKGFENANDLITHLRETKNEKEQEKILTAAVRRLYNAVSQEDVIYQQSDGRWFFTGKSVTDQEKKQIAEDAEIILKSRLWKEIVKAIKYRNNRNMYLEAQSTTDLLAGKITLFVLENIQHIIETAKTLKK